MIPLLLALALQAALEEGAQSPLPCKDPLLVAASSTGKFLAVAEAKKVHVLDGGTLKPVHAVDFECAAVGFDAKDELLTLVGTQVVRLETRGWKETFRADLPDVEFRKPAEKEERIIVFPRRPPDGWLAGQAKVSPEGDVYYRSKGGHLSVAREVGGKIVGEALTAEQPDVFGRIERVLAVFPEMVIVDLQGITGVVLLLKPRQQWYTLARSGSPLVFGSSGETFSGVHRKSFTLYSVRTLKQLWLRDLEGNEEGVGFPVFGRRGRRQELPGGNAAAVFDAKRSGFWIARGDGLHWWDGRKESGDRPVEGVTGTFSGLAIDGAGSRLYGVEQGKLRIWRFKD